jgi:large subunit ribosomal protein L6
MSRIGKKPIGIPKDVVVTFDNQKVIIKGKGGTLEQNYSNLVNMKLENNELQIFRKNDTKEAKSYHGMMRALLQNMVLGVTEQFSKILSAEGIGYKFQIDKNKLIINVGFSHPVEFIVPTNLTIKSISNTKISVTGINKQEVGLFASKIRDVRPPEPYKGKGILYDGEKIIRKAGKTGK